MASIILDSSAILAHLNDEPGSERVSDFLGDALISAVNYRGSGHETHRMESQYRTPFERRFRATVCKSSPSTQRLAEETGALRLKTKAFRPVAWRPRLSCLGGAVSIAGSYHRPRVERA